MDVEKQRKLKPVKEQVLLLLSEGGRMRWSELLDVFTRDHDLDSLGALIGVGSRLMGWIDWKPEMIVRCSRRTLHTALKDLEASGAIEKISMSHKEVYYQLKRKWPDEVEDLFKRADHINEERKVIAEVQRKIRERSVNEKDVPVLVEGILTSCQSLWLQAVKLSLDAQHTLLRRHRFIDCAAFTSYLRELIRTLMYEVPRDFLITSGERYRDATERGMDRKMRSKLGFWRRREYRDALKRLQAL